MLPHTKSVTIESELFCWGPVPPDNKECYQRLTINNRGSVFFTGYNIHHQRLRHKTINVGKEIANRILALINRYTTSGEPYWYFMDVGSFVMWETDQDGKRYKSDGQMAGTVKAEGINIGEYIMANIPIYGINPFGNITDEVYYHSN